MGEAKHILIQVDGVESINQTVFSDDFEDSDFDSIPEYVDGLSDVLRMFLDRKNKKGLELFVYKKLTTDLLNRFIPLLDTIKAEVRPIEDHPDPGAIEDCWRTVFETAELMKKEIESIEAAQTVS